MVIIIIGCHKKVSQWHSFPRKATVVASEVFHRQQKKIHWEINQRIRCKGRGSADYCSGLGDNPRTSECVKSNANLRDGRLQCSEWDAATHDLQVWT